MSTEQIQETSSEDRSQLLNLLNEEILRINQEETRPGWTIWALIAGLATCFWLLMNQFEAHTNSWPLIQTMLIGLTLLGFSVKMTISHLNGIFSKSSSDRIITIKEILSNSRLTLLISAAWVVLMLCLTYQETGLTYHWIRTVSLVFLGIHSFSIIIALILSIALSNNSFLHFRKDPATGKLEKPKYSRFAVIFSAIQLILVSVAAYSRVFDMIQSERFEISEFKISFLIISMLVIIFFIASVGSKSSLGESLIDLRRDLILEKLPVEQIRKQMDLALKGKKIDDYFNNEISHVLNSSQSFNKELFLTSEKINLYITKTTENNKFIEETLKESIIQQLMSMATNWLTSTELTIKKIERKEKMLALNNGNYDSSILEELWESINTKAEEYNELVKLWFQTLENHENIESAKSMIDQLNRVPQLKFNRSNGSREETK